MADKKEELTGLTDAELEASVQANVKAILERQKAKNEPHKWGIEEHVSLLWKIALDCGVPPEGKKDFKAHMRVAGIGGNSAQFRQSKFLKDVLPKSAKQAAMDEYDD